MSIIREIMSWIPNGSYTSFVIFFVAFMIFSGLTVFGANYIIQRIWGKE